MRLASLPDLLFEAERRYGARPAVAIRRGLRTEVWSYAELARRARLEAARLQAAGLRPGDRHLVMAPNTPQLVAELFGAWLAGAVLVPLDLRTPPELVERIRELSLQPRDVPADLAEIVFTSGTTGEPKGVMLTHANILANVGALRRVLAFRPRERLLSLLPLSHMLEQTAGLLLPLSQGATIYYATSRRSTALVGALARHRVTMLVCVPEILRLLWAGIAREVERRQGRARLERMLKLADQLPHPARRLLMWPIHARLGGCLDRALCGGAALPADVWQAWERLGVLVGQGYGLTETSPVVTCQRFERRSPDHVGWPLDNLELRLAPDGEVLVRGPSVTPGYWGDPAATAAVLANGWYQTGDLGEIGPDGALRLRGRTRELIVLADGRNVFPQDVEAELRREPAVKDCAAVGRRRPDGSIEVHAVILPADDSLDARAAVQRANARLGPHQQIGGLTVWPAADLPRTSSLKIKRTALREAIERAEAAVATPPMLQPVGDDLASQLLALLARAANRPPEQVSLQSDLGLDLGFDSLGRVELAVRIEEELGRGVTDEQMAAARSAADLLGLLESGEAAATEQRLPAWPRWPAAVASRRGLRAALLFPALRLAARPFLVRGSGQLAKRPGPCVFIANHASHLDAAAVLLALPARRRERVVVAAAADYFFASRGLALFTQLVLGGFPFNRVGNVSASLAHCGELVDDGWSILIFPEGTRSPDGRPQPFKAGIGLLARELGVPVVPVHLAGARAILPKGRARPRPGPLVVTFGEPLRFDASASPSEAVARLEATLWALGEPDQAGSIP